MGFVGEGGVRKRDLMAQGGGGKVRRPPTNDGDPSCQQKDHPSLGAYLSPALFPSTSSSPIACLRHKGRSQCGDPTRPSQMPPTRSPCGWD